MAKKINLPDISSGFRSQNKINEYLQGINDSLDNTLSLDGSTPNAMEADLDLNNNDLLNAGAGSFVSLTVNGVEVTGSGGSGGSLPSGGTEDQILVKQSATDGDALWEDPSWLDQQAIQTIIDNSGTFLTTGGVSGQILVKQSATDGDALWVDPVYLTQAEIQVLIDASGTFLPTGGSSQQILVKQSSTDGDAGWEDNVDSLGVNKSPDSTNKFAVASDAVLFDRETSNSQVKIVKNSSSDTASVLFQTNYSGRAEFGLTGDDDFHMKVSPDGTTFYEGILIDKDTGEVSLPAGRSDKPVFSAQLANSTVDYSHLDTIDLTVLTDTHSAFDATTDQWTCPVAGSYLVIVVMSYQSSTGTPSIVRLGAFINGTDNYVALATKQDLNIEAIPAIKVVDLFQGTTLELKAWVDGATPPDVKFWETNLIITRVDV